jgi:hypothetical protein
MLELMKRLALGMTFVAGVLATTGSALFACGSSHESEFDGGAGDTGVIGTIPPGGDGGGLGGPGDGGSGLKIGDQGDGGCQGLQCNIATSCGDGGSTTITGTVLDPAGTEPIYNAVVYVPMYNPADGGAPAGEGIEPIQGGVSFPAGVSCDSCSYLFTGNPVAVASTQPDGTFVIPNAPSGANIPVVVQIGKWRTHTTVASVPSCGTASAGSIKLPSKIDPADPIESMPQFALSMGGSDSLECLLYRMGIDLSEFTPGPGGTGHVHLFTGFGMKAPDGGAPPAPPGYAKMWDTLEDLEKYDVSVFSCEGRETTNADPQILEQYVNAGGRAFTSHYHYAWFTGAVDTYQTNAKSPLTGAGTTSYTPNADWSRLASWDTDDPGVSATDTIGVKVDTTLNGADAGPFLKGQALTKWLTKVNAFGQNGVPADEVPIIGPAFDPAVTRANPSSQEWAGYDPNALDTHGNDNNGHKQLAGDYPTAYFSFNTPVDAVTPDDGGTAPYCGRVVFTGLHVGAAAKDSTTSNGTQLPSTMTCNPAPGHLSPQEKLLEFILFDLSSCVTPDTGGATSPIQPIR